LLRLVEEGGSVPVLSLPPSFSSFPSPESWSMSDSEFCIGSGPTVVGPGVTVSCSPSSGDTGGSDCVGKGIDVGSTVSGIDTLASYGSGGGESWKVVLDMAEVGEHEEIQAREPLYQDIWSIASGYIRQLPNLFALDSHRQTKS